MDAGRFSASTQYQVTGTPSVAVTGSGLMHRGGEHCESRATRAAIPNAEPRPRRGGFCATFCQI